MFHSTRFQRLAKEDNAKAGAYCFGRREEEKRCEVDRPKPQVPNSQENAPNPAKKKRSQVKKNAVEAIPVAHTPSEEKENVTKNGPKKNIHNYDPKIYKSRTPEFIKIQNAIHAPASAQKNNEYNPRNSNSHEGEAIKVLQKIVAQSKKEDEKSVVALDQNCIDQHKAKGSQEGIREAIQKQNAPKNMDTDSDEKPCSTPVDPGPKLKKNLTYILASKVSACSIQRLHFNLYNLFCYKKFRYA